LYFTFPQNPGIDAIPLSTVTQAISPNHYFLTLPSRLTKLERVRRSETQRRTALGWIPACAAMTKGDAALRPLRGRN
jgi:hypothetical protein